MFSWEDQQKEIENYFRNHIAAYFCYKCEENKIEVLIWKKPETYSGYIKYIKLGNTLFVSGDHYEAVYGWGGGEQSLEWMGGLNLDYFADKCLASPQGRGYRCWNPDKAEKRIIEYLEEYESKYKLKDLKDDYLSISSKFEWFEWLRDYGEKYFGDYIEMGNIGTDIDYQCHVHLVGLKMATEQLKYNKE